VIVSFDIGVKMLDKNDTVFFDPNSVGTVIFDDDFKGL